MLPGRRVAIAEWAATQTRNRERLSNAPTRRDWPDPISNNVSATAGSGTALAGRGRSLARTTNCNLASSTVCFQPSRFCSARRWITMRRFVNPFDLRQLPPMRTVGSVAEPSGVSAKPRVRTTTRDRGGCGRRKAAPPSAPCRRPPNQADAAATRPRQLRQSRKSPNRGSLREAIAGHPPNQQSAAQRVERNGERLLRYLGQRHFHIGRGRIARSGEIDCAASQSAVP